MFWGCVFRETFHSQGHPQASSFSPSLHARRSYSACAKTDVGASRTGDGFSSLAVLLLPAVCRL